MGIKIKIIRRINASKREKTIGVKIKIIRRINITKREKTVDVKIKISGYKNCSFFNNGSHSIWPVYFNDSIL